MKKIVIPILLGMFASFIIGFIKGRFQESPWNPDKTVSKDYIISCQREEINGLRNCLHDVYQYNQNWYLDVLTEMDSWNYLDSLYQGDWEDFHYIWKK